MTIDNQTVQPDSRMTEPVAAIRRDTNPVRWLYVRRIIERITLLWDSNGAIREALAKRDGAVIIAKMIPDLVREWQLAEHGEQLWLHVCSFYRAGRRTFEALTVMNAYYQFLLDAQRNQDGVRIHKGTPLVMIGQCYQDLGWHVLAKRYFMLALMEDAIQNRGHVEPGENGCYFRLVWHSGLRNEQFIQYVERAWDLEGEYGKVGCYPEALLQLLDTEWMTELPSRAEAKKYIVSQGYAQYLVDQLGTGDGHSLERLGQYLLACMPGCCVYRRGRTRSTDHDLICSVEGVALDFRSELGRYFVCECKDYQRRVGFPEVAKFCRVLHSVKARFGIIFTPIGLTGCGRMRNAHLEAIKLYHDTGIVLVDVTRPDIDRVVRGGNLISLLRTKYEAVVLGLERHPGDCI